MTIRLVLELVDVDVDVNVLSDDSSLESRRRVRENTIDGDTVVVVRVLVAVDAKDVGRSRRAAHNAGP
jgi:hypothetical protein